MPRTKQFDRADALLCALNVFWCKGYEATSMQDLVDAMGINRQSLYDTYGDKKALYIAALEAYDKQQRGRVIEMLDTLDSPAAAIRQFLESILAEADGPSRQGCFVVNSTMERGDRDPNTARLVRDNQLWLETSLESLVRKGQSMGEFGDHHDPAALARFLYTTIVGLRVVVKAAESSKSLDGIVDVVMKSLAQKFSEK